MPRRRPLIALTACLAAALAAVASAAGGDLLIVHARIYASPEAALERGALLIRAGRIASIGAADAVRAPAGVAVLDAHDAVVTAGFWNSHVHLLTPAVLHARERDTAALSANLTAMFTRWGFTTVFDLASPLQNTQVIRQRIAAGEVIGPRILTVGEPFFPEHGTPIYVRKFLADNGFPSYEVATPAAARARARRELAAGADGVKIFAGAIVGGEIGVLPMPLDIASAAVREARRVGKPAFAHPSNAAGVEIAVRSGVDVLAHTAPDMGPWDAGMVGRLLAHHMALVPTLQLFEVENRKAGASAEQVAQVNAVTIQQLRAFADGGGTVIFGTDVGYIDVYDPSDEYRLMSRALNWRQILASLTVNPAHRFKRESGALVPGAAADLTILGGDPAEDVAAFAQVRYTIRNGKVSYSAE